MISVVRCRFAGGVISELPARVIIVPEPLETPAGARQSHHARRSCRHARASAIEHIVSRDSLTILGDHGRRPPTERAGGRLAANRRGSFSHRDSSLPDCGNNANSWMLGLVAGLARLPGAVCKQAVVPPVPQPPGDSRQEGNRIPSLPSHIRIHKRENNTQRGYRNSPDRTRPIIPALIPCPILHILLHDGGRDALRDGPRGGLHDGHGRRRAPRDRPWPMLSQETQSRAGLVPRISVWFFSFEVPPRDRIDVLR